MPYRTWQLPEGGRVSQRMREIIEAVIQEGERTSRVVITKILASDLVTDYAAASLIGTQILTARYGDWPGGAATILEVAPDPEAPEIVLWVRSEEHGEIGVFDHEEVGLFNKT